MAARLEALAVLLLAVRLLAVAAALVLRGGRVAAGRLPADLDDLLLERLRVAHAHRLPLLRHQLPAPAARAIRRLAHLTDLALQPAPCQAHICEITRANAPALNTLRALACHGLSARKLARAFCASESSTLLCMDRVSEHKAAGRAARAALAAAQRCLARLLRRKARGAHRFSALFEQFWQVQRLQNCPAAKQSQYSLRQRDFLQLHRLGGLRRALALRRRACGRSLDAALGARCSACYALPCVDRRHAGEPTRGPA